MAKSKIEWTEHTWNPFAGCAVLSPGCTNCYAMKMAARLDAMGQPLYKGLTKPSRAGPVWRGTVRANPDALLAPLRRKKPTTYFVNSMSDLFYEKFSDELIDSVFAVMALSPQHTFQVLTKRPERMRDYCVALQQGKRSIIKTAKDLRGSVIGAVVARASLIEDNPVNIRALPNVWLGVSAERQKEADERIPLLLQTPAAVRFVSCEPMLGEISLRWATWDDWSDGNGEQRETVNHLDGARNIDWLICGGESGPNARPMHPDWARSLRDECAEAGVPFFFKQWGEWTPGENVERNRGIVETAHWFADKWTLEKENLGSEGGHVDDQPDLYRVGKAAAGRHLDGLEHNAMPKVPA